MAAEGSAEKNTVNILAETGERIDFQLDDSDLQDCIDNPLDIADLQRVIEQGTSFSDKAFPDDVTSSEKVFPDTKAEQLNG
uniref:Uncharacterized protein n=2 Tax=Phlebotomus papatasi TaxID=29031 RepID=A0A1B0D8C0_PHLPP